ncbi:MAG TPA: hypothetical protein VKG38_15020, partial [Solirubrobacteraceae bacterium]|nr:hypothetical protein [Solirubrobacteraceae bacterium]
RIEAGEPVTTTTLIRVLRTLGLTDGLDQVVPEPRPSPVELLKTRGKLRQRASGRRGKAAPRPEEPPRWRWGDETPGAER